MRSAVDRRVLLKTMGLLAVCGLVPGCGDASSPPDAPPGYFFGQADSVPLNGVRYFPSAIALVCRDTLGLYALSALCSHESCNLGTMLAGCGIDPENLGGGFNCCCHGAFYDPAGEVISGPATRALTPWLVTIDETGGLWVALEVVSRDARA